ncbi:MAG: hypothetical protein ABR576_11675 [Thermoanaerobaculia bacterium]
MPAALLRLNQVLGPRFGYDPTDERAWGVWDTVEGSREFSNVMLGLEIFTHDMSLARRAARVVEVHDGRILREGSAAA